MRIISGMLVVISWWCVVGMGQQPPTATDPDTMTEAPATTPADASDAYGDAYGEAQPTDAATQSTPYPAPQRPTGHGAWTESR